jgi:hypothetical protein
MALSRELILERAGKPQQRSLRERLAATRAFCESQVAPGRTMCKEGSHKEPNKDKSSGRTGVKSDDQHEKEDKSNKAIAIDAACNPSAHQSTYNLRI